MVFISKQDYDLPHMDGILDIDGWCPIKQIMTKQMGQNIITTWFWTNISKVEEQCNDDEDTDISDDGGKAQNDNDCNEQQSQNINLAIGRASTFKAIRAFKGINH
jgi:hypothetical protein